MDWRKSTYSGTTGGQCVETASDRGVVLVRDTVRREAGPIGFSTEAWSAFTVGLK
jgi:hypothetical protein